MEVTPMPRRHRNEETLVTAEQIALRWQVHRDTIYRIARQRLPYLQLGRATRRYRWEDVDAYEQNAGSEAAR